MLLCFCFVLCVKPLAICPPDCPEPPSVIAIIGGSIASVALIGILVLMLVKLLLYMKDLKEFKKFENEKKKGRWADVRSFLFFYFNCLQKIRSRNNHCQHFKNCSLYGNVYVVLCSEAPPFRFKSKYSDWTVLQYSNVGWS